VGRAGLLDGLGRSDPLIRDALESIIAREGFLPPAEGAGPPNPFSNPPKPIEADAAIVTELIEQNQASVRELRGGIRTKTGTALLEYILDDVRVLQDVLFDPRNLQVIMAAVQATWWLKDHLAEWLGDRHAADAIAQSAPGNVSAEMGLALLDVADTIRGLPNAIAFLEQAKDDDAFLDKLESFEGGKAARDAIESFLDRYGMRCVGEIDITRPRWAERPSTLIPAILANLKNFGPGEGTRRFEFGRAQAATAARSVIERLRALPDGDRKADEAKRMIDRVRTFIGYREYPKYGWVCRYFIYKQALFEEADRLRRAGVLRDRDDISYLRFEELREVVRTNRLDYDLIRQRKEAFKWHEALTPPRVLTSDGEAITGVYRRDDLPDGALVGLGVSAGTVEGRARVIANVEDANLEPGDILVTTYTDPSWSPLFLTIAGLVTEVGGLMTHGAVVAREYGLPAVVGVVNATTWIEDGQRIRVNGTDGCVEVLG
jgi:pyruvate,water dikinase